MKRTNRRCIGPVAMIVFMAAPASVRATTWYVDVNATNPAEKVCSEVGATPCDTVQDCANPETETCACPEGDPVCGKSWCNAFTNLQDAFDAAITTDTILIAGGVYQPNPAGLADARDATFLLPQAGRPALLVTIEGGYAGCGAADEDERDLFLFETILSGDLSGNDDPDGPAGPGGACCSTLQPGCDDVTCEALVHARQGSCTPTNWPLSCVDIAKNLCCDLCGANLTRCENSYHVVTGTGTHETLTLDGVTITAGNSIGWIATGFGGGYYTDSSTFDPYGEASLVRCTIEGNTAKRGGGGIYAKEMAATFTDCIIRNNVSDSSGGGAYNNEADATYTNCLFEGNIARTSFGGGMYSVGEQVGNTHVENGTFVNNFARPGAGGAYFTEGFPHVTDTILWNNRSDFGTTQAAQVLLISVMNPTTAITYTAIEGCGTAVGNICHESTTNLADDPLFVPGPSDCYYLSQSAAGEPIDSPCVDAGSATAASLGFDDLVTTRSDEIEDTGIVDIGFHFPVSGFELLFGDLDRDGIVTLEDYFEFATCFTGVGPADVSPCCRIFDDELDGDVDLGDFASLQLAFGGP